MKARDEIEEEIFRFFEENFEMIRAETGQTLKPDVKEAALQQVVIYWRRLNNIANNVTDTEIKLNLPEQVSPRGRKFNIEGVVDLIRENDQTIMYDIKTHETEAIKANLADYEKQLNVYAYIWQKLRGQALDATAIISTTFPPSLKEALQSGDETRVEYELPRWNPLIEMDFNEEHIAETIEEFGTVVDNIEDGKFSAPPVSKLFSKLSGMRTTFATSVCRNCDARYSCISYRIYTQSSQSSLSLNYPIFFQDTRSEADRDSSIMAALNIDPTEDTLRELD